ncbi:Acetamidase [Corynebacterium urogenitale]|uniref:Acetamidase n=1 Tax=Corynebacterium urogenitale TaxID=2487892 RepID=A0A5J6Z8N7_9CORY|nr:acetamidase/formamidase family protein [Corynebacterium urogenitale]QFQ03316.1 Acetamidase [Corynebacterium urogenitale]
MCRTRAQDRLRRERWQKLGHNRWHPEIPPVATIKPGTTFRADCREWFDGFIKNDDSAEDIRDAPLHTVHTLTGPFHIEGAEPGDLLIVDIVDIGPIPNEEGPLALPPEPDGAILGSLSEEQFARVAAEAARTAPPRENGGNQDIKNLTKGTRVFYPVFVDGANLSFGDLHFSQGDGEITFCGAIEMGGFMELHVDIIKGGMATYGVEENAIFMPGKAGPDYSEWLAFSGTSVTLEGEQRYLDSHLAYQRAILHAIDYLTTFGYTPEQAYLLLGAAPIEFDIRPGKDGPTKIDPGMGAPRAANPV